MYKRLFLVIGISIVGIVGAQSMPFHQIPAGSAVSLAGGCGIGVHRWPYNGCNPVYYGSYYGDYYMGYRHGYRHGYYVGRYQSSRLVDHGPCNDGRMYPVCDDLGVCWAACY